MNGVKHSGSRESILVVADSFFPVRVHDRADDERGVKIPLAYTSLVEAVVALGSMAGMIVVDCFQSLSDDLTVTAITHLIITPRGHVVVASGKTLTINGRVTILASEPFAGPGSVAYGANAMRNIMGPANMSGMAGRAPIVNAGEDGFEWGVVGGSGGGAAWGDITGTLANQTDLDAALGGKAAASHPHAESDITGLVTDLAGKAAASHGHGPSDITGTAIIEGDARLTNARTPTSHAHPESEVTNLVSDLAAKETAANKGAVNGYASLGADGKVPAAQLPASGSDPWTFVKLASDFTTSAITNDNVPGLAFTPAANKTYLIIGKFLLRTATATVGPRTGVAWPSGLADGVARMEGSNSLTTVAIRTWGAKTTQNTGSTGVATTVDSHYGELEAHIIVGASPSGAFQITLASETAGTVVTMKAGSFIAYREI